MQWMLWYWWRTAVRPLNGFGQWRRKEREREQWHATTQLVTLTCNWLAKCGAIRKCFCHCKLYLQTTPQRSELTCHFTCRSPDLSTSSSMGPLSANAMRCFWPVFGLHHSPRILRNKDVREPFLKTLRLLCDCNRVNSCWKCHKVEHGAASRCRIF